MLSVLPSSLPQVGDEQCRLRAEPVRQPRELLEGRICSARQALQKDLHEALQRLRSELPPEWLALSLGEFLRLENFTAQLRNFLPAATCPGAPPPPTEGRARRRTVIAADKERRVTRSMAARQSSVAAESTLAEDKRQTLLADPKMTAAVVPATPKFHPGLPETPAHIRRRGGRPRKSSSVANAAVSNIFGGAGASQRPSTGGGGPRATIRASIARTSGAVGGGKRTAAEATGLSGGMGLMSLELDDGKLLDVDLAASPSKLMANLGADAVREMKAKMQAYATQLRSFFKRLRVNNS